MRIRRQTVVISCRMQKPVHSAQGKTALNPELTSIKIAGLTRKVSEQQRRLKLKAIKVAIVLGILEGQKVVERSHRRRRDILRCMKSLRREFRRHENMDEETITEVAS